MERAKEIARKNLKDDWLRIWWSNKYKKSSKSEEYNSYTQFELLVEFFEDRLSREEDETNAKGYKKYKTEEGIAYYQTGDPLFDKWEKLIAEGREDEVNLNEGLSDEEKEYEEWKDGHVSVRNYTERGVSLGVPSDEDMGDLDKEMISHE